MVWVRYLVGRSFDNYDNCLELLVFMLDVDCLFYLKDINWKWLDIWRYFLCYDCISGYRLVSSEVL